MTFQSGSSEPEASRDSSPTTDRLIDCVLSHNFSDLPADAVRHAKTFLADTLAVGVAGKCNPASDKILAAAQQWDGDRTGTCRILGREGIRLSPHSAAVVNGLQIHALEWDALHEPSVVIALCTTTAALLSEVEERPVPLDEMLLALIVGVETAVFFGAAAKTEPRFFRPSAAGLMGAAMAIGRLRKFDRMQMTNLMGIAYSQVSGTMQAHWEGSETLPLQIGIAARAALTAADLVTHGMTGPHDVVDGKFGYFKLIEQGENLDAHFNAWGNPWKITEVAHKPFPAGRATQATLTALMDMRADHDFEMKNVASLTAYVPSLIKLLVGRSCKPDMQPAYARLCLEYVAPMMIRQRKIDPSLFTAESFTNPQTLADAAKIHVILDDNPDPNALSPQKIVLELNDGRTIEQIVDIPFGSPLRPLSRADELTKASQCFAAAAFDRDPKDLFVIVEQSSPYPNSRDVIDTVTQSRGDT
ncbi:MmgE/PrpD family protein [Parasphingorhabdus sp.]|uniref:MmgE/PrpD family protein n=1 Tax=Parasphingorhabdus sp. TaxID=2709688 RepID=UPI003BB0CC32